MRVGRNGHRCHRRGEWDGNKFQRRNLSVHPLLIWCQEQTGNSQNVSLCFSSSISMPFSELLASNKSYENLFLNRLLIPAFSGRFQREKNRVGSRCWGQGRLRQLSSVSPGKRTDSGWGVVMGHPDYLTRAAQEL